MKIRKIDVPKTDLISRHLPGNYRDAFECVLFSNEKITADDFMIAFWTYWPRWVDRLFKLRNIMVKPFGIKGGDERNKEKWEEAVRTGGSYGFTTVEAKSDTETVISANDKHLKFFFSVKTDMINDRQQKLTVSTVVHFHNRLGYAYFYTIYPFHLLIVPSMIRFSVKSLLSAEKG